MSPSDSRSRALKTESRDSRIHGRGLFASLPIARGELVSDEDGSPRMNHSCEPNVGVQGEMEFVALADIPAGEELTFDYAMTEDGDLRMFCECGTRSCRGVVTGSDWKKIDVRAMYEGFFSRRIQKRIDEIK